MYWLDSSGWLGIAGLAFTLTGFGVTLLKLFRTASAADEAKRAAQEAIGEVRKVKIVVDLSAAVVELEEMKRVGRSELWAELPERLSRSRRLLIGVGASNPTLSEDDQSSVLDAIVAFSEMEKLIVKNSGDLKKLNGFRINSSLVDHSDRLLRIISRNL